jgi:hypothetical protein
MQRWIAGILAMFNLANGVAMLFASSTWWASVPGWVTRPFRFGRPALQNRPPDHAQPRQNA